MQVFARILAYLKGTRQELRHVNWPSRRQTLRFTLIVIGVSVVVAVFLGLLDILFQYLLDRFVF